MGQAVSPQEFGKVEPLTHVFNPTLYHVKTQAKLTVGETTLGKSNAAVYDGILDVAGKQYPCAVKKLTEKQYDEFDRLEKFFKKHQEKYGYYCYPKCIVLIHGFMTNKHVKEGYIVMEKMDMSIFDMLFKASGAKYREELLTPAKRIQLIFECIAAVEELHDMGVPHRDLKSPNYLLSNKCETVKLCDFGSLRVATNTTVLGSQVGTVPYMSPEQIRADLKSTNEDMMKSDVYRYSNITIASNGFSMGVMLIELAWNCLPYGKDLYFAEKLQYERASTTTQPFSKDTLETNCPEFRDCLFACIEEDPSKRPTAKQLVLQLQTLLKKKPADTITLANLFKNTCPSCGPVDGSYKFCNKCGNPVK